MMNLCKIYIIIISNGLIAFAMINVDLSQKSPYLSSVYDAMKSNVKYMPENSAQSYLNLNQGITVDNRYKRNVPGRNEYYTEPRFNPKIEEEY